MKVRAKLWDSIDNNKVKCHVCANECVITPGKVGICRTRKNLDGQLYTLIYGSLISEGSLDPIEKKPLYNFWPGATAYSIASIGCSFRCQNCQNWSISQACPSDDGTDGCYDLEGLEDRNISLVEVTPEQLIKRTLKSKAKTLAFTYNEPLIWHEWVLDVTKLLKKEDIKTILVSNGYSTPEATKELIEVGIDAANIDIKAMSDDFYKKICGVKSVQPVLDTCKRFKEGGIHVEITNLIIPDLNDSEEEIKNLSDWVVNNLGKNTPTHFSAYHPDFKMPSMKNTPNNLHVLEQFPNEISQKYVELHGSPGKNFNKASMKKGSCFLVFNDFLPVPTIFLIYYKHICVKISHIYFHPIWLFESILHI